jgi:hypothetical protein
MGIATSLLSVEHVDKQHFHTSLPSNIATSWYRKSPYISVGSAFITEIFTAPVQLSPITHVGNNGQVIKFRFLRLTHVVDMENELHSA